MFAGYNMVTASGLVYGGELSLTQGATFDDNDLYSAEGQLNHMIDLRGRLGKVFGSTLVYGALGYSMGSLDWVGGGEMAKVGGINYGVGFETAIGQRGFAGVDVTRRDLEPRGTNEYGDPSSNYVESLNMTTVSVRVGFRF